MGTVLFVHGTGVRRTAYEQTFALLGAALQLHGIDLRLEKCSWGDTLGAARPSRSVPGMRPDPGTAEDDLRWALLVDDPFTELRVLAARPDAGRPLPPGAIVSAHEEARVAARRVLDYILAGAPRATLVAWGLEDLWPASWATFLRGAVLVQSAFEACDGEIGEPGRAAARAATACLLIQAESEGRALPTREHSDAFVIDLTDAMGVLVAGVVGFLKAFFTKSMLRVATREGLAHRGALSVTAGPIAGDVLLYQARGTAIRAFVKQCISSANDDVLLLAHSLGGIACVDLLVEDPSLNSVRGLITVGSQAPLFCEIGALVSMPANSRQLPAHFPRWLNIFDPEDFLSYLAQPVFGGSTADVRVDSGQPFPLSHGAYWSNPQTWHAVKAFARA